MNGTAFSLTRRLLTHILRRVNTHTACWYDSHSPSPSVESIRTAFADTALSACKICHQGNRDSQLFSGLETELLEITLLKEPFS